jgi:hypothetical protein
MFHIKTDTLVEMVKKQQDILEIDISKGILPDDV